MSEELPKPDPRDRENLSEEEIKEIEKMLEEAEIPEQEIPPESLDRKKIKAADRVKRNDAWKSLKRILGEGPSWTEQETSNEADIRAKNEKEIQEKNEGIKERAILEGSILQSVKKYANNLFNIFKK